VGPPTFAKSALSGPGPYFQVADVGTYAGVRDESQAFNRFRPL